MNRKADLTALLNALVFVARCDRDFHRLERDSLEAIIVRFWLHLELRNEPDIDSILHYADKIAPDAEIFWVSVHRCAADPKLAKILKRSAREVIDADGQIVSEEFYWGRKLDEFLSALSVQ